MEHLLLKLVQMLIVFLALMLLDKTKLMPIATQIFLHSAAGTGIGIATNSTSDTVTITATGGGGSSYTDSDVDTHLNVSGAFRVKF